MPAFISTDPHRRPSATPALMMAVAIAVAGCTSATEPSTDPPGKVPPPQAAANTPLRPVIPADPAQRVDLRQSFAATAEQIPGRVSVSMMSGSDVYTFGGAVPGPAWSTMKVPVAIAAMRLSRAISTSYLTAAITQSDNAAAESLWSALGTPADAARAVESVLHDAGDFATMVESERIRAGFTAFGQTEWTTAAQATFAWQLPCLDESDEVLQEMRRIAPGQQWGFAGEDGAAAKGGWGPAPDGSYLVRQFALLRDERGSLGVAMAASPDDGTFESGVPALSQLADWVDGHRPDMVQSQCTREVQ